MKRLLYSVIFLPATLTCSTLFHVASAQVAPAPSKVETLTDSIQSKRTQRKEQPTPVIGEKLQGSQQIQSDTVIDNAKRKIKSWNADINPGVIDQAMPDSIVRKLLDKHDVVNSFEMLELIKTTFAGRLKKSNIYIPRDTTTYQTLVTLGALKGQNTMSLDSLQKIQSYVALQGLYEELARYILFKEELASFNRGIEHNLDLIARQSDFISRKEFSEYRFTETSRQILKGINIYHDNDVFCPVINKDMNYTGGLRVELTTDLIKIRLLSNTFLSGKAYRFVSKIPVVNFFSKEIRRLKIDNISYQSIFYGIEAYTPYLRFDSVGTALRMNGNQYAPLAKLDRDHSYQNDRPFAGIAYIGRAKYRINEMGTVRARGEFSIGILGGKIGESFQSALHRDLTIDSPAPIGWDNQIADGGRLTINMSQAMEFMLLSRENDVFKNIENIKGYKGRTSLKDWINVYSTIEGRIGQQITYAGAGVGFSNLNFKERSGTQMIKNRPGRIYNFIFSFEVKYRRVVHNSMLEGFGWFKTREFDNDGTSDESLSKWKLEKNVINRNMIFTDLFVGFRSIKTMIFFNATINSREFYGEKIDNNREGQKSQLFNTQKIYAFGRIGFNFLM
ncbi:lipid A-modifier LpxR family protein [Dyadobacter diqingensis]|uniref:lipid A-modifier LpxR family protein n=1 Tax=Dyadobacter diqingensis TaxID=2938121 RepID=UPI0020C1F5EA|nr:lipid A-modifier LpxR family protein [Dyadobacter diqingensis]